MVGSEITIAAHDGGSFMGYLSVPASGSGPGVVVIQEIFGVNAVMRGVSDWLAGEGYVALCPDLFWRQEPGIQLTDGLQAEWDRAFELFGGFDLEAGVKDLDATVETLRGTKGCLGKVGAIGFCLGGRLAYLAATRAKADAAVGYYGVMLDEHLDEAINCPLALHMAGEDQFAPPEVQQKLHAALDGNAQVALYDYPGQGHAFARVGGEHYDKASADLANRRSLEFLKANLG